MPSPTQLYNRARVLFLSALGAIVAAVGTLFIGSQALPFVLALLILASVLFIASIVYRRMGDAKRRSLDAERG